MLRMTLKFDVRERVRGALLISIIDCHVIYLHQGWMSTMLLKLLETLFTAEFYS